MIDTSQEYDRFLREFEAFLRARSKRGGRGCSRSSGLSGVSTGC